MSWNAKICKELLEATAMASRWSCYSLNHRLSWWRWSCGVLLSIILAGTLIHVSYATEKAHVHQRERGLTLPTAAHSQGMQQRKLHENSPAGFKVPAAHEVKSSWWKNWLNPKQATGKAEKIGCHHDCYKHGNCNLDEMRCECRFGYGGEDCSVPLAPACIVVEVGEVIDINGHAPRCCDCLKQLSKLFSVTVGNETVSTSAANFPAGAWYPCFQRKGVPAHKQNSTYPKPKETVTWHRIIFSSDPRYPFITDIAASQGLVYMDAWGMEWNSMEPVKTIVDGDRRHEHCKWRQMGQRQQYDCECTYGYSGMMCDKIITDDCPNNCSNNGKCKAMFCHCNKGSFGFDCSRNATHRQPDAAAVQRAASKFRIFMYELPPNVAFDTRKHDPNYISYVAFRDQLARDWNIRTDNPWEASLFFIPDVGYWANGNTGDWWPHQHRVFQYLYETYPFWQRHEGRDHFHFVTRDRGACDLRLPRDKPIMPPMKIVHFGYHEHIPEGDNSTYEFVRAHSEACFRPMRDLVVPGYLWDLDTWAKDTDALPRDWKRDILLFFRGGVRKKDPEYSGGVRQHLETMLANNENFPDVSFNRAEHQAAPYQKMFQRSIFCLAPWGHGWGLRLNLAMACGCIPVIIQDHIVQPFEYVLPYYDFSIRLSAKDMPQLISILRGVGRAEVKRLQAGVKKHHRAFLWQLGGEAYNNTINTLKQHWTMFKAGLDKRKRALLVE